MHTSIYYRKGGVSAAVQRTGKIKKNKGSNPVDPYLLQISDFGISSVMMAGLVFWGLSASVREQ